MKKIRITLSDEDYLAWKQLSENYIPEGEDAHKNVGKTILFFAWLGGNFAVHSADILAENETKDNIKASLQAYHSIYGSEDKL